MNTFHVSILAAERVFFEGECESLVFPAQDGQCGIMAHHVNEISAVVPGTLRVTIPGEGTITAAVSDGLIKVENNRVLLLLDTIERPEEIDENRARLAAERAHEVLLQKRSEQEFHTAEATMARAVNRLRVRRQWGKR